MKRLAICAIVLWAAACTAIQPPPEFRDKAVTELLSMLDSTNASTRANAAATIAWYLERNRLAPNSVETSLIGRTTSKALYLLREDGSPLVRLASVSVLRELNTWTNTTQALSVGVVDKDCLVRVRAISALHSVCQERRQQLSPDAVAALKECLEPAKGVETLWQAAFLAGELGIAGVPTIPSLERLSQHPSKKVKKYSTEALLKLRSTVSQRIN